MEFEPINRLAVINNGVPIEIEVKGSNEHPDLFGEGAYIRFIAEGLDTLYTDTNVFALRLDHDKQRLMSDLAIPLVARSAYASSYLARKPFAPQERYSLSSPDASDPWYAKRVVAIDQAMAENVVIELDDFIPGGNSGSANAKMNLKLWGGSDLAGSNDDHHVKVSFNGVSLVDETFDLSLIHI